MGVDPSPKKGGYGSHTSPQSLRSGFYSNTGKNHLETLLYRFFADDPLSFSIKMARHMIVGGYLFQLRFNLGANRLGGEATRMEAATRRWV